MKYKLAKQLRDAGFKDVEEIAALDLAQLIGACGDRFMSLVHHGKNETGVLATMRSAISGAPLPKKRLQSSGSLYAEKPRRST